MPKKKVRITEVPTYQKGGKTQQNPPVYVDSPNDPRYRAYQDSLNAYNLTKRDMISGDGKVPETATALRKIGLILILLCIIRDQR